ncbi:MAG: hypothetical protein ACYCWE_08830 [Eubacteriales bacterium]
MNRNYQTLILTFILALITLFTSCNNNISRTVNFSDTADKTVESGIYRLNTLDLPDGYKISSYASDYASKISKVITHDGRIYAVCNKSQKYISDGHSLTSFNSIIYSVDFEGNDEKILLLEEMNPIYITSFDMDSEGNFYLLVGFSTLYKLNSDGILISQIKISEPGSGENFDCLKIGDDGILYLTSNTCIKILNSELVILYDIEINEMNLNLQFTPDGKLLVENIYTGYNGLPYHYYINEAEKRLEKADILTTPDNVTEAVNSYSVKFGEGYDIYFYNSFGVYGYNAGDENAVMLCDWVNSGLYFEYTRLISLISPDKMVCISRDMFAETDETVYDLIIMTRDENAEPKITITLAYADRIDEVLLAAINFNRLNDQYRIVFKDYSIYNTPEDWSAENKFKMDLIAGVIPDMMLLSMNMPYADYIDKGLFADLYGFFDRDGDLSRDDILYAVRTRYETDGKLYCLPTSFFIETLTGKASLVGEKESLTLDEFYGLYEKAGTGASVCNIINTKYFLKSMLRANLGDFVDYKNLICSFDSEKFIKYIGFIKNLPITKPDGNIGFALSVNYSDCLEIKDNKLYLSQNSISGPESFIYLKYIYGADKFAIKGFPTENTNGSLMISNYTFGISASSECRNGAFEFLKYYLSDKMQTSDQLLRGGLNGSSSGSLMGGLPVTVSALDIVLDKAAGTYYYLMEMDSYQTKTLGMLTEYGTYDPELDALHIKDGFTLYRFTDEDAKWFRDYLTESKFENKYDAKINEIIWEELDLYFEGAVTAEKAAENIQNRAAIYVNERYG